MLTYTIVNGDFEQDEKVLTTIENIIDQFELIISQKTSLSKKKGSVHYHLKKGKQIGLIEVTYWSKQKQLLVEIHDNRRADWNIKMIEQFTKALAKDLDGMVCTS